jgi:MOSC domain-containing protein YiiM
MPAPVLLSILVGQPCSHGKGEADESHWTTAFFKRPVAGPVFLGRTNLVGDAQADRVNHGGPDKAVCAYSADHYDHWRRDLNRADLPCGAFGENFTLRGVTETDVCIGDVWAVGPARVQVSQPRQPCWKMARRWGVHDLPARVVRLVFTGWYFRVLEEGIVEAGLELTLLDRPHPTWTVEAANQVMHHRKADRAVAAELAEVSPLSSAWRESLARRAAGIKAE